MTNPFFTRYWLWIMWIVTVTVSLIRFTSIGWLIPTAWIDDYANFYAPALQNLLSGNNPYTILGFDYGLGFWLLIPFLFSQWSWWGFLVGCGTFSLYALEKCIPKPFLLLTMVWLFFFDLVALNCQSVILLGIILAWHYRKSHPALIGWLLGWLTFKEPVLLLIPFFVMDHWHLNYNVIVTVTGGIILNLLIIVIEPVMTVQIVSVDFWIQGILPQFEHYVWFWIFFVMFGYRNSIKYKVE